MQITSAKREELREIAAFLHACWQTEYSKIVASDFLGDMSVDERHAMLLGRFDADASAFLTMRDGVQLVGAVVFGQSATEGYSDDGEISAIYLHHDAIGKGHGHALFTKAEDALRAKGYRHFVLDVLSQNERALHFYLAHGYKKVRDSQVRLGARAYPLTVMRKEAPN
ncbi:MAG: GNAT family N-acetyltransferase [Oscillospiraceae bacterium]|jgi:ribosomal protein S18 acetylase RimI-like enzyme|nr:GNAT family N-acetyltransferase [Oscillospiraceae bacterium]